MQRLWKIAATRMWANAQRDGRRAKYRWRPLFNAAKFVTPTREPCSNASKTRNSLKFAGCPKLPNRPQPLVGRSSPCCKDMWRYKNCCLTIFFRLSIRALVAKSPTKLCDGAQMANFWPFFASCIAATACTTFQTCILNSR